MLLHLPVDAHLLFRPADRSIFASLRTADGNERDTEPLIPVHRLRALPLGAVYPMKLSQPMGIGARRLLLLSLHP